MIKYGSMDDAILFHCDEERLKYFSNVMGVEGYFPCLKCKRIHELYTYEDYLDYQTNKEGFRRKYRCIYSELGL